MILAIMSLATSLDVLLNALDTWAESRDLFIKRIEAHVHMSGRWPEGIDFPVKRS